LLAAWMNDLKKSLEQSRVLDCELPVISWISSIPLECPACNVPVEKRDTGQGELMGRDKKYQPEQMVNLLRQIEVAIANGKTTALACKEAGIVEQTYFRWRKEYGGLQVDQAKRLKELEQENSKLKRLVANLSLDNLVLKDFASGNF
jgi:putative transposase